MADTKTDTKKSTKSSKRKRTTARRSATSSATTTEANSKAKSSARNKPAKRTPAISPTRPTRATPSVLDAAARVLGETKKPMRCKEMVEVILAGKYWSTKGRTPAATLYSALLREIQRKGRDGRFRKTERGKFALRQSAS